MKQILFFLLLSSFSFSQSLSLSDENLIHSHLSLKNERLYLFYSDKLIDINLKDFILDKFHFIKPYKNQCFSTSFSHIFQGGYSAGYYSYKWSEVLDADAFELFKEKGIFNAKVAKKFENHILSKGGTKHPMKLYKSFRGKEPDPEAIIRRSGLEITK